MAFKMKRPMIMGTPMHKHAVSSALKQDEERRGDDEVRRMVEEGTKLKNNKQSETDNKPLSPYEAAKKKDPNLDTYIATRKDPNASEMEKAKAQDAINAAYGRGPTNRAEKLKAKTEEEPKKEEPKKDSSKPAEKADTSKGTNIDKIAEGKKPEGAEKASGRMKPGDPGYMKLPESEKLKIQKAAKVRHKKALEAWRSGGRKGRRPRRKDYY
jgi:hypothetical protein